MAKQKPGVYDRVLECAKANLGQLLASWALTGTKAIFGYAPLLLLFALLTGLATGAVYGACLLYTSRCV